MRARLLLPLIALGVGDIGSCGFRKLDTPCFTYVVTSDTHTCGRKTDGTLYCWGNNQYGQLGLGLGHAPSPAPELVDAMANVVSAVYVPTSLGVVSSQTAMTCARTRDSRLFCWGNNQSGALATGDTEPRAFPTRAGEDALGTNAHHVMGGGNFLCTRTNDHALWCWGSNQFGQLGTGDNTPTTRPLQVAPSVLGTSVKMATAGGSHVCAVRDDGSLWCWGNNMHGQLGTGDTTARSTPTLVAPATLTGVALAFAGADHTCAVKAADGSLWCWGRNTSGQLGMGDTRARSTPERVTLADLTLSASLFTAGAEHTCAVKANGTLWCWGSNRQGQLGTGAATGTSPTPEQAQTDAMSGAVELVYGGGTHTCARTATSEVWCWGGNQFGQLGVPGVQESRVPRLVAPACK